MAVGEQHLHGSDRVNISARARHEASDRVSRGMRQVTGARHEESDGARHEESDRG